MALDAQAESRRSERKPSRKAVVLIVESDDSLTRCEANTVDISAQGARIEMNSPLTPGQIINLIQPDDPGHTLRCLVVWAGDVGSDGQEHAGLEFLDPAPTGQQN